jgi:hypothetical protein
MLENGAYSRIARIRAPVRLEAGAGVRIDFHADGDLYDLRRRPLFHDHVPPHFKIATYSHYKSLLPLSRKLLFFVLLFFVLADRIER